MSNEEEAGGSAEQEAIEKCPAQGSLCPGQCPCWASHCHLPAPAAPPLSIPMLSETLLLLLAHYIICACRGNEEGWDGM